MTQEEKSILLKDLCARVSNGGYVKVSVESTVGFGKDCVVVDIHNLSNFVETTDFNLENVKPYLRPMSSMTEKEQEEYMDLIIPVDGEKAVIEEEKFIKVEDFYNQHLLDYRGLIPKGLALEALEGMYNIENI